MHYAFLIYEDEAFYGPNKSGPAMQEIVAKHMVFARELGARRIGGAGLKESSSATTLRRTQGKTTVHDGPFAEAKEQLGGFYIIDATDLDAAIALAKKIPVSQDGSIEIRPLLGGDVG
ncbi:MAG: YciI family protein [Proteobacteria bacterium]|nr:YciI family protein [Pseudomonadota bacterium]